MAWTKSQTLQTRVYENNMGYANGEKMYFVLTTREIKFELPWKLTNILYIFDTFETVYMGRCLHDMQYWI